MSREIFESVSSHVRETALLEATLALLEWDERTGLPSKAGGYRAEQATLLSGMIHRRKTDDSLGEKLEQLADSDLGRDLDSKEGATIARLNKDFQKNRKLPVELVEAISKATVLGQQAWEKARKADDWLAFKPHMEEIFKLRKQEAALLKSEGASEYDALLDNYEEGAETSKLVEIFGELRDELVTLVQQLSEALGRPTTDHGYYTE